MSGRAAIVGDNEGWNSGDVNDCVNVIHVSEVAEENNRSARSMVDEEEDWDLE